jgi:acetyltransferase-like isoleucine patch superfamily enzyme
VRIGRGVVTERRRGMLSFLVEAGGEIEVGEGVWLRTELGPVVLAAFTGGRLEIGPESMLNGCHLSAKSLVRLGRRVFVGPGVRVFDADQHDLDDTHPERIEPVLIDDHAWIASDSTVLRGARIGAHAIVGARSLVTGEVPAHRIAHGIPARPRGVVGDRSRAR